MAILPEDIIPAGVEYATFQGKEYRKGSVAAFLANIDILENPQTNHEEKALAIEALTDLAPAIRAIGLAKHASFKNPIVNQLLFCHTDKSIKNGKES